MTEIAFVDLSTDVPPVAAPAAPSVKKGTPLPKKEVKASPKKIPRVVAKAPQAPPEVPKEQPIEEPPAADLQTVEEAPSLPEPPEASAVAGEVNPPPSQNDIVLGLSRGFFQTLGSGRTLLPEVRDYYIAMLEQVNRRWWGVAVDHRRIRREVMAVVIIDRNGTLLNGWIARSSGDPLLDELVLGTLRASAPFPPLPEEMLSDYFQAPIRLVPPVAPDLAAPEIPLHGGGALPPI